MYSTISPPSSLTENQREISCLMSLDDFHFSPNKFVVLLHNSVAMGAMKESDDPCPQMHVHISNRVGLAGRPDGLAGIPQPEPDPFIKRVGCGKHEPGPFNKRVTRHDPPTHLINGLGRVNGFSGSRVGGSGWRVDGFGLAGWTHPPNPFIKRVSRVGGLAYP